MKKIFISLLILIGTFSLHSQEPIKETTYINYFFARKLLMTLIKENWPKYLGGKLVSDTNLSFQKLLYSKMSLFKDKETFKFLSDSLSLEVNATLINEILKSLNTINQTLQLDLIPFLKYVIQMFPYHESILENIHQILIDNWFLSLNANQTISEMNRIEYIFLFKTIVNNTLNLELVEAINQLITELNNL